MFCVIAVVGTIVEGLNSLASSLPVVGTAAAALVALFNIYKMVKFNKVAASNALFRCDPRASTCVKASLWTWCGVGPQEAVAVFAYRVQDLSATYLEVAQACGNKPAPQLQTFADLLKSSGEVQWQGYVSVAVGLSTVVVVCR